MQADDICLRVYSFAGLYIIEGELLMKKSARMIVVATAVSVAVAMTQISIAALAMEDSGRAVYGDEVGAGEAPAGADEGPDAQISQNGAGGESETASTALPTETMPPAESAGNVSTTEPMETASATPPEETNSTSEPTGAASTVRPEESVPTPEPAGTISATSPEEVTTTTKPVGTASSAPPARNRQGLSARHSYLP